MFQKHGIDVKYRDIKRLFDMVDQDKTGSLDLDEFKQVVKNKEATEHFKEIIKKVRNDRK